MKQNITLTQWDEITKEQKNILWDSGFQKDWAMNIGQMLEFLGDDFLSLHIDDDVFFVDTIDTSFYGAEPIIPLWEAIKFKLKQ